MYLLFQPTLIFSSGNLAVGSFFLIIVANANVIPPILPININAVSIILDAVESVGVMPSESPTVPIADAVSYRQSSTGNPSIALMAIPPKAHSVI